MSADAMSGLRIQEAYNKAVNLFAAENRENKATRRRMPKVPLTKTDTSHNPRVCKFELDVIEPYHGPPCKKGDWTVRGCELHEKCVRVRGTSTHSCDACDDYSPDLGPWRNIGHGRARDLSRQVQIAAKRYLEKLNTPNIQRPRGIIVSGGGKYLPSAYITIRAIRHQDTSTPVELWYYGEEEYDARYEDILKEYGVKFVDVLTVAPYRYLKKYAIKSFAVRHCDFETVIHLDADSYPVGDMSLLWNYPAIFWPDIPLADNWINWEAYRVPANFPTAWETGQYLINRSTYWGILNLAYWYDQHADYSWHYGWGDTGTWRAAWSASGKSPAIFAERPDWVGSAYLQMGPDGKTPMFLHRCRDKFRIDNTKFYTGQHHKENVFDERFPLEKECFAWLDELKGKL